MSFERILNTDPRFVSRRLFFAKANTFDTVWHLCDAALGNWSTATGVEYVALHGRRMHVAEQVDTVLQVDIRRGAADTFCQNCLDEFHLAVDLIKEKRLLKFR